MLSLFGICVSFVAFIPSVSSIALDVDSRQSILNATALLAHGVQELYNGNQSGGTIGKWPYPPYYWWESGGAWGGMMGYWHATKDESYDNVMMEALVAQLGSNYDYDTPEEAFNTGNDDQAFWVFDAMSAAEYGFPAPPAPAPDWHIIAQNAWEDYVYRWNTTMCGGGLKWQFHPENAGFFYKNSISNGAFFQISARLARFTGNQTYVDWAEKIWDWVEGIGLMSSTYDIYDGTDEKINCSAVDHHQWTYNVGVFLYGAATLANYTNNTQIWVDRTTGLLAATDSFFTPYENATNILFEAACELQSACNVDQWSMKAYLARWMATSAVVAPYIKDRVGTLLRASAQGAASACTSGQYGNSCGSRWYINGFDNITGLGQQLSALEVVTSLLVLNDSVAPRTLPNVTIPTPPLSALPTTVAATSDSTSTANPLHDPPPNGASKRATTKYGGLLVGLAHALV
ncbi:hypothetical protein OHC33_001150 [Knufia fluminis]|uniref:Mannan endo-1,6-alpha-mannosidase n=1 Tax=Knufia fluminis TaxID=191047 RepID=A0AAN8EWU8_9EURO|nr:hypothetical protein OHC33_001150 [Knufia fluminis]